MSNPSILTTGRYTWQPGSVYIVTQDGPLPADELVSWPWADSAVSKNVHRNGIMWLLKQLLVR